MPMTVWILGWTSMLTDIGSELIFPLLPEFLAALGGFALLGLIEGFADATSALLKIPAGALSDRMPRRMPLVMLGYGIAGAVRPLMAFATVPWHALAVRVTDRVGKGIRSSPRDALLAEAAPRGEEARAFGIHRAMDHAGAVIGPLIAAGLVALGVAITDIFLIAAIPGALAFVVLFFVREQRRVVPPRREVGRSAPLPGRLRGFIAIMVVFALAASSDAFVLLRAKECGTPTALIPVLWTLLHVVKLASVWGFGILADRVSKVGMIGAAFVVYAACYALLGVASEMWQAWTIILVYGLYYGLAEPSERALVRELAPADARGRAFGWYHGAVGVACIPAGLMTGALWAWGGARPALWTCAGIALVACGLLWAWARAGGVRNIAK